ncbi:unnamed protein product [Caenorhabditis angaria]|uniref:E2F-associated phosphoprotein n=1 Tax=Caenorhabditis angaria TaxID=860376 RepID=A0A9P1IIB7_9PELO|nr:unnamed protein product [Caenorhabditis angaria]
MINDDEDQCDEVNSATMRKLAFERIDDDYYLGSGAVGDDLGDSDDDLSSDDEVKSTLRKIAGYDEKKEVTKDAFGRKRRKSEFEDEMDDELDRSITEYANEHMGAGNCKIEEMKEEEDELEKELIRQANKKWLDDNEEIERRMSALEMLPYDVDLTDSEVDPEMPAAVVKDKTGQAIKLVYSCKRGHKFNVDDRRNRQKERRRRVAESSRPKKEKQAEVAKNILECFKANEQPNTSSSQTPKTFEPAAKTKTPLASILKKNKRKSSESLKKEEKEEKMEEGEEHQEKEEEEETNPIKKAAKEREKEIAQNDELFYDDEEDDENEKWVKEKRKEMRGSDGPAMNEADGVLSCPGCMVELTRDCQRHEVYKTQYRAMFVSNCQIDDQKMMVEKSGKDKRRDKQKAKKMKEDKADGSSSSSTPFEISDRDLFQPVKCAVCGTLVAMMDHDEVYHFFNVLSGYS